MLNCDTKHSKTFAFHGMLPTATHPRHTKLPQINNTHAPSNCISIHKAAQIFINKQNTVHLFKNNCHAFARSLALGFEQGVHSENCLHNLLKSRIFNPGYKAL